MPKFSLTLNYANNSIQFHPGYLADGKARHLGGRGGEGMLPPKFSSFQIWAGIKIFCGELKIFCGENTPAILPPQNTPAILQSFLMLSKYFKPNHHDVRVLSFFGESDQEQRRS